MKVKIICIFIMTLLIATALPAFGAIKTIGNDNSLPIQNGPVDQKQTTHCGTGTQLRPPFMSAQSFKPTKENLTAVQIWLFKNHEPVPGIEITVSIREALNGTDLTVKTINADDVGIEGTGTWVFFNFEDITVIPEETYYIVCRGSYGSSLNNYCWLFDVDDKYTRGEAWFSNHNGAIWITLWENYEYSPKWREPDYCFKTYFQQSKNKSILNPFLNWLHTHPNLFPILR